MAGPSSITRLLVHRMWCGGDWYSYNTWVIFSDGLVYKAPISRSKSFHLVLKLFSISSLFSLGVICSPSEWQQLVHQKTMECNGVVAYAPPSPLHPGTPPGTPRHGSSQAVTMDQLKQLLQEVLDSRTSSKKEEGAACPNKATKSDTQQANGELKLRASKLEYKKVDEM